MKLLTIWLVWFTVHNYKITDPCNDQQVKVGIHTAGIHQAIEFSYWPLSSIKIMPLIASRNKLTQFHQKNAYLLIT